MVSFELGKEIEIDAFRLFTSVEQRKNSEFLLNEERVFDSSSGLWIVSLSHVRDKTKNIFLHFFIELKTYQLSHSILLRWTHQINNRFIFHKLRAEIKLDFESSFFSWKGKLRGLTREIYSLALYQHLVPIMRQGV